MPSFSIINTKDRYNKVGVQLTEEWASIKLVTWVAHQMNGKSLSKKALEEEADYVPHGS